jgi:hypothetical protein
MHRTGVGARVLGCFAAPYAPIGTARSLTPARDSVLLICRRGYPDPVMTMCRDLRIRALAVMGSPQRVLSSSDTVGAARGTNWGATCNSDAPGSSAMCRALYRGAIGTQFWFGGGSGEKERRVLRVAAPSITP